MSTLAVSPPYRLMLEAALLVLPGHSRDRYRHEFAAELFFVPRRRRVAYLIRVLVCTIALRAALTSGQPELMGGITMTTKPLRCRLGRHVWVRRYNDDDRHPYTECQRCGTLRTNTTAGTWIGGP